jgi:hypothetical protein
LGPITSHARGIIQQAKDLPAFALSLGARGWVRAPGAGGQKMAKSWGLLKARSLLVGGAGWTGGEVAAPEIGGGRPPPAGGGRNRKGY